MSRNIRPGAGAFPSRPTRTRQDDSYNYTSDPGGGASHYGKPGRNDLRYGGDDDGYYSQSQRSYGAGSNGRRDDGRYPDRGGYNRSDNNKLSTGSTASTTSSSGSSLLDRMKVRSTDTSARTSIDDDSERMPARRGGWARNPPAVRENRQREEELDEPAPTRGDPNSAGNTLWERITAATANLTINVSKAWENGVSLQDGEETPPGGETRLTRALKAYYIERARAPADLPPWLFEEHERRPQATRPPPRNQNRDDDWGGGRRSNMAPPSNRGRGYDDEYERQPPQAKRGALRDIYDSAAASNQPKPPAAGRTLAPASYRDDGNGNGNVSRATSRLQALRDAKRLQPSSTGTPASGRYDDPGGHGSANQGPPSPRDRYQVTEDDGAYGGYEGGRRPVPRSEGGSSSIGRSSYDDGDRRPPLRAAMGLPSRPQRGGGY